MSDAGFIFELILLARYDRRIHIETTAADIEAAFTLLETTLLKKSDELTDACRSFFEKLKAYLKKQAMESFYSKEVRSAFRLSPSSLGRYLFELERMGYIKITRGNRYKGFEYKVCSWKDLEQIKDNATAMVKGILENIRAVTRNPAVTQRHVGLHKAQRVSKKQAVTQEK